VLSDDFEDGVRHAAWDPGQQFPGCSLTENGELVIGMSGSDWLTCGYQSLAAYDLTQSAASIEIPLAPGADAGVELAFGVENDYYNQMVAAIVYDELRIYSIVDGNTNGQGMFTYSATDHRWLRVREEEGLLHWERSSDGSNWSPLSAGGTHLDASAVMVGMFGTTISPLTGLVEMRLDNYNVTP
jgi:hypothetical protein